MAKDQINPASHIVTPSEAPSSPGTHLFTATYFRSQVVEFHQLMGLKSFWFSSDGRISRAVNALIYCFIHTDIEPQDAITFEAVMIEFNRRYLYMVNRVH